VEHVFGHQENSMGGTLIRTIGMARAKTKIGMKNLAYNMQRFVFLLRTGQRYGISTLKDYVEALGGEVQINAVFPDNQTINIVNGH